MTAGAAAMGAWVVFQQPAGETLALSSDAVVRIGRAPRATRIPFAPPGVEGVISERGTIMPLVSLAALLRPDDAGSPMAPRGDLIVVRSAGTYFALRVGRVLFTAAGLAGDIAAEPEPHIDPAAAERVLTLRGRRVACLAIDRLGLAKLAAWHPPSEEPGPVADARQAAESIADDAAARRRQAIIAVRADGEVYGLSSTVVTELFGEPIPITHVPLTPPILSGIAVLGGAPMAVFSLARLLGLDDTTGEPDGVAAAPSHVAVRVGDGRLLLAVDRILGLHHLPARRRMAASLDGVVTATGLRVRRVLEVSELIEPKMLAMVAGIGRAEARLRSDAADRTDSTRAYLSLTIAGRLCALALDAVERIVEPPLRPIRLPAGSPSSVHGAMPVSGEVLPLTDGRRWLLRESASAGPAATACVILRGDTGRHALVADAVHRIVRIPDRALFPADDPDGRVAAVGEIDGHSALILSASRLTCATEISA